MAKNLHPKPERYVHLDGVVIGRLIALAPREAPTTFIQDLMPLFNGTVAEILGELATCEKAKDAPGIKARLHRLKGIAASLGAGSLSRMCKAMEEGEPFSLLRLEGTYRSTADELNQLLRAG